MFSRGRVVLGVLALMIASLVAAPAANAATPVQKFERAVGVDGITKHLKAFQRIANQNDGNRASGLPGFDASVKFVRDKLKRAGYETSVQKFDFDLYEEQADAEFEQLTPEAVEYTVDDDFSSAEFSGSGEAEGDVTPVDVQLPPGPTDNSSTSGCEAEDFASFPEGDIALVQRGTCDFGLKAENADEAGASGVIIFNEGQPGRTDVLVPTLGEFRPSVPVIGTSFEIGQDLASEGTTARISVTSTITPSSSKNVIADTKAGRENRTVVVGAHLDSVPDGPGINDNGSGSAQNLEMALQMSKLGIKPRNQVRFAFWGAEESGLIGSTHYVDTLKAKERRAIDLNLNFDMVGSPNYGRFIYDGDGDAFGEEGPAGSDAIERSFERAFAAKDLATEPTAFDGRSDYYGFITAGIPAGGLFSGAEDVKSEEQVELYGGTAGEAFDPCYHQECDDINNVSNKALNEFSNAAAQVTFKFAQRKAPIGGNEPQTARASVSQGSAADYRGSHLVR
ncbi:M20/M25/M40 family metallo-hydrolase [Thermoleophilia bacterium SCSIO 60948]|nr:M20/M25/M40 family metallo-hydrolase [Thermoleophilia bacterium SCSIO 60948]